jgi:type IV pilus assembly protein PilE
MKSRLAGFTLLELLIAVAILGILASIAIPSYQSYIRKSRRADAIVALSRIQLAEEKWRANNTTYGSLANIGVASTSDQAYYTLSIANTTGTGYVATAAAPSGSSQASDTGCTAMTVTVNGALSPTYYGAVVSGQPGLYYGPNQTCWAK